MNLLAQLESAGAQAAREAAERQRQQDEWLERKAKGLPQRRGGLADALRKRLPTTAEAALTLDQIRDLLTDIDYIDSGLSAALSYMVNSKEFARIGEKYSYRYYRLIEAEKGTS